MNLPRVAGWIIDFRTADAIFSSGSNARINHCVGLCESGQLFACHCEITHFKGVRLLKASFIDDQNCICTPDNDILGRCNGIANGGLGRKRLVGNDAAVFMTATPASMGFGVISNHRSPVFTTVFDLCNHYGIPVLSADEYFARV
jgi:hypothetical protein